MRPHFIYLSIPKRGLLYAALGVWFVVIYALERLGAPSFAFAAICVFLAWACWQVLRQPAAGMEVISGEWHLFLGDRSWVLPLRDLDEVRILGPEDRPSGLALRFFDGRTDVLPPRLATALRPHANELRRRGVPLMA